MDPEDGKVYKGEVWAEDGKLKVRGYADLAQSDVRRRDPDWVGHFVDFHAIRHVRCHVMMRI